MDLERQMGKIIISKKAALASYVINVDCHSCSFFAFIPTRFRDDMKLTYRVTAEEKKERDSQ